MSTGLELYRKVNRRHRMRCGSKIESGFTLVELLIVMVVSLIIMAGIIGLTIMAFDQYRTFSNLQAVSDTGRMAISAVVRQLKAALRLAEGAPDCTDSKVTFWADVLGKPTHEWAEAREESEDPVFNYTRAPKIEIYLSGTNLVQRITEPGSPPVVTTSVIGSDVQSIKFYYYPYGAVPDYDDLDGDEHRLDPAGENPRLHENAAMVVVRLTAKKGTISKTFTNNVYLRSYHIEHWED